MKLPFLIGATAFALSTAAIAQDASTPPPPPPPGNDMGAAQMPQSGMPPPADPNAGTPTGDVPPATGMTPADPNVPKDPAAPVGSSANPVTVGGNAAPPPSAAKDYPVCSKSVQDSCVNPSEAKHKARGKRR
jgi:hypothetical protein